MNILGHILFTYFFASFVFPNAKEYLVPIAIFSFIIDFDHQPGFYRVFKMNKKELSKWTINEFLDMFRTEVQEPVGILTIEAIFLVLYLFGVLTGRV